MVAALVSLAAPATGNATTHPGALANVHARTNVKASSSRYRLSITTQSPANGATVSGTVGWQVKVTGTTPSRVDFAVDGSVKSSDSSSPYTYGLDTKSLSNGSHTLTATAYSHRNKLGSTSVTVMVENSTPAPAPAPTPPPEESNPAPEAPAPPVSEEPAPGPTPEPAPAPSPEPAPEPEPSPAPAPAPSSIYWGAWIGSQFTGTEAPWDMNAVSAFEGLAHKPLSLVQFASPFADCNSSPCSFYNFPTTPMENIRKHGAIPFFSWSSQSTPSSLNEPNFQLSDVIAGTYDSYLRSFATAAKNWGHPFYLRFDWEMNGNWFPWSEGVNGNKAGEYVTAWRHVHDIFTSVGATNVSWVWCPNIDPGNEFKNIASLYPGDGYVDWTGLDGYNWGTNPYRPAGWKTFDQLYNSTYHRIADTIAPSKPMAIGEVGSTEYGGSKAAWIREMLGELPTAYPKIHGLLWFNRHAEGEPMDWSIESSTSATEAFAAGIQSSSYVGSKYAALPAGTIQPPS